MKKALVLLLSLLLAFSLSGCAPLLEAVLEAVESELTATAAPEENLPAKTLAPAPSETPAATSEPSPTPGAEETAPLPPGEEALDENGIYDSREAVALYLYIYGRLPNNYITKSEARDLGWESGGLKAFAPDKCIGGDRFGNYEGLLPTAKGRTYTECDIDTLGKSSRGAKRIVFSNDGLIYYTQDHYESFELLYGEE